jgi:hypothetical protein
LAEEPEAQAIITHFRSKLAETLNLLASKADLGGSEGSK